MASNFCSLLYQYFIVGGRCEQSPMIGLLESFFFMLDYFPYYFAL